MTPSGKPSLRSAGSTSSKSRFRASVERGCFLRHAAAMLAGRHGDGFRRPTQRLRATAVALSAAQCIRLQLLRPVARHWTSQAERRTAFARGDARQGAIGIGVAGPIFNRRAPAVGMWMSAGLRHSRVACAVARGDGGRGLDRFLACGLTVRGHRAAHEQAGGKGRSTGGENSTHSATTSSAMSLASNE